jgi:hypothetical protein
MAAWEGYCILGPVEKIRQRRSLEIVFREAYLVFRQGQDCFWRDTNDERRFTVLVLPDAHFEYSC